MCGGIRPKEPGKLAGFEMLPITPLAVDMPLFDYRSGRGFGPIRAGQKVQFSNPPPDFDRFDVNSCEFWPGEWRLVRPRPWLIRAISAQWLKQTAFLKHPLGDLVRIAVANQIVPRYWAWMQLLKHPLHQYEESLWLWSCPPKKTDVASGSTPAVGQLYAAFVRKSGGMWTSLRLPPRSHVDDSEVAEPAARTYRVAPPGAETRLRPR